jgi:hypothetical protein
MKTEQAQILELESNAHESIAAAAATLGEYCGYVWACESPGLKAVFDAHKSRGLHEFCEVVGHHILRGHRPAHDREETATYTALRHVALRHFEDFPGSDKFDDLEEFFVGFRKGAESVFST